MKANSIVYGVYHVVTGQGTVRAYKKNYPSEEEAEKAARKLKTSHFLIVPFRPRILKKLGKSFRIMAVRPTFQEVFEAAAQ